MQYDAMINNALVCMYGQS